MDEIEQYQTRIYVALDKISRGITENPVVHGPADKGDDADLRKRDLALIEELEATLRDERADLDAERQEAENLKRRLEEAEKARLAAVQRAEELQEAADAATGAGQAVADNLKKATEERDAAIAAREAGERDLRQCQDQIATLSEAMDEHGELEDTISRLQDRIDGQDLQFQRLKDANAQLRESNAILREKNAQMLADSGAIDQSLMAELTALKNIRAAEVDEMTAILEELKPMVEGQRNA